MGDGPPPRLSVPFVPLLWSDPDSLNRDNDHCEHRCEPWTCHIQDYYPSTLPPPLLLPLPLSLPRNVTITGSPSNGCPLTSDNSSITVASQWLIQKVCVCVIWCF